MALNWEYCECGCHGHEAGVEGNSFWLSSDLEGSFYLHEGHGRYGLRIGVYKSWEEASRVANEKFRGKAFDAHKKLSQLLGYEPEPPELNATETRFNRKDPV